MEKVQKKLVILIIPDLHNQYAVAEHIIEKEKPDQIIFLGDYFDSYYDSYEDASHTSAWLANSLRKTDRIHLIGNHDLSYMTDNPKLKCTGYTSQKHEVIKKYKINWKKLQLYHWIDDQWLCTHAGLSNLFYEEMTSASTPSNVMEFSDQDLEKIDDVNYNHKFFQVGRARNGLAKVGGILWCDYNEEFQPIPDLKQIFGHTPLPSPSHLTFKSIGSENICLDTGLRNYAIYEKGKMIIRSVIDLK